MCDTHTRNGRIYSLLEELVVYHHHHDNLMDRECRVVRNSKIPVPERMIGGVQRLWPSNVGMHE
jgi:hypothetical protein